MNLTDAQKKKIKENMFKTPFSTVPLTRVPSNHIITDNVNRIKKLNITSCDAVDVSGAFTLDESNTYLKYLMGYYVYFYINGTFNQEVTLETVKVKVYRRSDLIKTFGEDITFTNVVEEVTNTTNDTTDSSST